MLGTYTIQSPASSRSRRGRFFANIILADEINRAPAKEMQVRFSRRCRKSR
ncbi:MAG: hypothetical protein R3F19_35560 [Verrucomicrobiales bacterium]